MISQLFWMMLEPTTLLVFFSFLLVAWYLFSCRKLNLPPGPTPWPIVGNIPYALKGRKPLYARMMDAYREFGPVVRLRLGPKTNVVFIFGYDMIHKAGVKQNEDFKYRPNNIYVVKKIFNGKGLFLGSGDQHAALRKFSIVALRDFGVGKRTIEERIQEESRCLCEVIQAKNGKSNSYLVHFKEAVSNIIASIVYGERFEYDDPQFQYNINEIDTIFKRLSLFSIENYFPFLAYLPGSKVAAVIEAFKRLEKFAKSKIQEHRETFDPSNIRDFVDLYLQSENTKDEYITEDNLFRVIVEFFNAGTDTTATALSWAILHLIKHPHIQEKCRAEILKVAGTNRMVKLEDKKNMPHLQATINETLRLSNIAPQSAPHYTIKDVKFAGYDIPKDTLVFFNLYSCLMDPEVWENPEEFRPERFLTESGDIDEKKENFIPFSIGGRACLGKHLARMELFIFLGTLLQRFIFESPPGAQPPDTRIIQTGITSQPKEYNVCAIPF